MALIERLTTRRLDSGIIFLSLYLSKRSEEVVTDQILVTDERGGILDESL